MPFRFTYVGLLALWPIIVIAFWPRYFGVFAAQPWAVHLHGLTATAWIVLVTLQSWSIAVRKFGLHRALGLAMFGVVPLFAAGALTMMQAMIRLALAKTDPFHATYGLMLALGDLIALPVFLILVFAALGFRRHVWLHGGAMLATVLLVLPPVLARLLPMLPVFPQDSVMGLAPFVIAVDVAEGISTVVALVLAWRYPKAAMPFLFTAVFTFGQTVAMEGFGYSAAWANLCSSALAVPTVLLAGIGISLGVASVWAGWRRVGLGSRTGRS